MNSYRDRGVTCTSSDLLDGGGGGLPQHTPFRHTPNGHPALGPSDPVIQPRISVPKMGVRARIAEWPPRRAQSRESLLENGQIGSNHYGDDGSVLSVLSDFRLVRGGVARLPRRRSKDVGEFGGERSSPFSLRVFPPLRKRSNSEVTLSEQDENEVSVKSPSSASFTRVGPNWINCFPFSSSPDWVKWLKQTNFTMHDFTMTNIHKHQWLNAGDTALQSALWTYLHRPRKL